jgi:predicted nucleic-acid-binding protein
VENKLIDANVLIRFLVESPQTISEKFKGVFTFFPKIERGEIHVYLSELVLFEVFFVLTKFYQVPQNEAAQKLSLLVSFKGIQMLDKSLISACLEELMKRKIDLVDVYLLELSKKKGIQEIYSFDHDLKKLGLRLLDVE